MKTTTRTPRNGSAPRAPKQAATPPDLSPAEFKVVRLRECPVACAEMENPQSVEKFWREHVTTAPWFKADRECLVVILLDTRHQVMGFEMLSQGTKDTLLVNVSEVFRMAAIKGAAKIILAHNHPSGNPSPSAADMKVTRELINAGKVLKIELLDHVIIGAQREGEKGYSSLVGLGCFYDSEVVAGYSCPDTVKPPQVLGKVISKDAPDLESAICQSIALVQLLADREIYCEVKDLPTPLNGTFNAGVSSLAADINERLRDAFYNENGGIRVVERRAA